MSRYRGNGDKCPHCGITYRRFPTGLTFAEVRVMLWSPEDDPNTWRYKRRRTVLGYWHMLKLEWWKYHIDRGCPEAQGEG